MPRQKVLHFNSPVDDEHTACGRQLAKTLWTLMPAQVTCLACKKVIG